MSVLLWVVGGWCCPPSGQYGPAQTRIQQLYIFPWLPTNHNTSQEFPKGPGTPQKLKGIRSPAPFCLFLTRHTDSKDAAREKSRHSFGGCRHKVVHPGGAECNCDPPPWPRVETAPEGQRRWAQTFDSTMAIHSGHISPRHPQKHLGTHFPHTEVWLIQKSCNE